MMKTPTETIGGFSITDFEKLNEEIDFEYIDAIYCAFIECEEFGKFVIYWDKYGHCDNPGRPEYNFKIQCY